MLVRCLATFAILFSASTICASDFRDPQPYPPLPEAISSFGSTATGDHIYVFGGHLGRVTGNSVDVLSPKFVRLNLQSQAPQWEELAMHKPSQSPALVNWNGVVYRVGGLRFKNQPEEKTDYESLDTFAKYDPETNTWHELPSLPQARSSHEAAVVDGKLYVVGGWNLQGIGTDSAHWHEEALVFDLGEETGDWKPIATQPFKARGLAAVAHRGKLVVLGGMNSENGPSNQVHVYDPQEDAWTSGPDLNFHERFGAFALASASHGDRSFINGQDGTVYELTDELELKPLERLLHHRSFHRLVATNDKIIALGGVASLGGYLSNVECVEMNLEDRSQPKFTRWEVNSQGDAKQSQLTLGHRGAIYAMGGNCSSDTHSGAAFSSQAFRFDVANQSFERLPDLPVALRSGTLAITGSRNQQTLHAMGGLALSENGYGSTDTIYSLHLTRLEWDAVPTKMPTQRSMFRVGAQDDTLYIFGGSELNNGKRGIGSVLWKWNGEIGKDVEPVEGKDLPHPRRSGGSAQLGSKLYLVGGMGTDSRPVQQTDVFDMSTLEWVTASAPVAPRVFGTMAASGGKLYLSGGLASFSGNQPPVETLEVYDPASDAWTTVLETQPADCAGLQIFEYQGKLLYYGLHPEKDGVVVMALLDPEPTRAPISPK